MAPWKTNPGLCTKCGKIRKLIIHGLCLNCDVDRLCRGHLTQIETSFAATEGVSQYSRTLFSLYLSYIRRNRVHYFHTWQARQLSRLLSTTEIPTIRSWMQIYELERAHGLVYRNGHKNGGTHAGYAFYRIGYMLEELGILPPRREDLGRQIQSKLDFFSENKDHYVHRFARQLQASRRAPTTVIANLSMLRDFQKWLTRSAGCSILEANEPLVSGYLASLHGRPAQFILANYHGLDRFYRWCKDQSLILAVPTPKLVPPRPQKRRCVLSESDLEKIRRFVRNPKTHPESALLLCLTLFFGLNSGDLATAQLEYENERLRIIFRRPQRTARTPHRYRREQILELPAQPAWFAGLQRRFYRDWRTQRDRIRSSFPGDPLLLPSKGLSNRLIAPYTASQTVQHATTLAIGRPVPVRILRQTCGHLHAISGDASILTRLGWSPAFAFEYTWVPRTYFTSSAT